MNVTLTFTLRRDANPFILFHMVKEMLPDWSLNDGEIVGPIRTGDLANQLVGGDVRLARAFLDTMREMGIVQ